MPQIVTKKPVSVVAWLWDGSTAQAGEIIEWVESNGGSAHYYEANESPDHKPRITIKTTDAWGVVHEGWWMMMGVDKDFYPCRPDIFERTYDYPPK